MLVKTTEECKKISIRENVLVDSHSIIKCIKMHQRWHCNLKNTEA